MTTIPNAKLWVAIMHDSLQKDIFAELVVTLWAVQYARRKAIYQLEFQAPRSRHLFVKRYLVEMNATSCPQHVGVHRARVNIRETRDRPPQGYMKINVDRAVGRHGNRGVAATICLDHLGNYMGSSSMSYLGINGVPTLEALACREALALAKDLDISRVLVSSNCAIVINDIETNQG